MPDSSKRKLSPRQRMINLMYLVLIALLALNISSDVLDGFNVLNKHISYITEEIKVENNRTAAKLYERFLLRNDSICKEIVTITEMTDSLCNYIESVKRRIVLMADGEKGDVMNILNGENREAVAYVMLSPVYGEAKKIKHFIDDYNNNIINLNFNYIPFHGEEDILPQEWNTTLFENCAVAVVVPLLSNIQQNIRRKESCVLDYLAKDMSGLKACIIPEKQHLLCGENFKAKVLVYEDNNQIIRNVFFLNKQISLQNENQFSLPVSSPGTYTIEGYAEILTNGISSLELPFKTSYSVSEPAVIVSPVKINVVYAGYPNELQVAVPSIPPEQIQLSSTQGVINRRSGSLWEITPTTPDEPLQLIVSYPWKQMVRKDSILFRVIKLPDPCAFLIDIRGGSFRGGSIGKQALLRYDRLESCYEDSLLDVSFEILSFDLIWYDSFGNQLREHTTGCMLSDSQRDVIKSLPQGKTCYFSSIQVKGADGIVRVISPIEVVVN